MKHVHYIFGVVFRAESLKRLSHGNQSEPDSRCTLDSHSGFISGCYFCQEIEGQLRRAYPGRVVSSVNDVLTIASHMPLSLVLVDHLLQYCVRKQANAGSVREYSLTRR